MITINRDYNKLAIIVTKVMSSTTYTHIHGGIYAKIYFWSAMVIWLYGAIGFGAKKGVSGVGDTL